MENPNIKENEILPENESSEDLPQIIFKEEIESGEPITLDYRPGPKGRADDNRQNQKDRTATQRKINRLKKELASLEETDVIKVKDLRAGAQENTNNKNETIKGLEDKLRQLEDEKKQLGVKMEKLPVKRQTEEQKRLGYQIDNALKSRGLKSAETKAEPQENQILKERERRFINQNKRQIAAAEFLKGKQKQEDKYLKAETLTELVNLIGEKELVKDANGQPVPTEKIIAVIKNGFDDPAFWRYFSRDGGLRDRMIDIVNDYRRRWSAIYLEAKNMNELYDIIQKSGTVMIKKKMYTPEELISLIKQGQISELPSPALKDIVMLLTSEENLKKQKAIQPENSTAETKEKPASRFKKFWQKLKTWRKK